MRTSKKEARGQNARRDLRPACRRRYAHDRRHCLRAGQSAHPYPRPACRRANDFQIARDRGHARRPRDEKLPAKTSPSATAHALPKSIHQEAVPAQGLQPEPQTHPNEVIRHPPAR
jgi:hypothetical protein